METDVHLLFTLWACQPAPYDGPSYIVPADGQTAVQQLQPLRVQGPFGAIPGDYPIPPVIEVFDLEREEVVPGELSVDEGSIQFVADEGWRDDTDYVWTVRDPLDEARQPEFEIDPLLQGSARFSTSDRLDVLGGGWTPDGLCFVLSAPRVLGDVRLSIDEEDVGVDGFRVLTGDDLGVESLRDSDLGVAVACTAASADFGERARITVEGRPFSIELVSADVETLVAAIRKGG